MRRGRWPTSLSTGTRPSPSTPTKATPLSACSYSRFVGAPA